MFTKLISIEEFKAIFTEILINKSSNISKVSDGSVVNGIAFGNSKIGQKIVKDIAALEARIFPDSSYGTYLDDLATLNGVGQRFGAKQSSVYVRVNATPGTVYQAGVHIFKSLNGYQFTIDSNYTVGQFGWGYVKVRSVNTGKAANVDAFTITTVYPQPAGHQYCINEYAAQYGTDSEVDDVFRVRVKEGVNILSRETLSSIEQSFMKINENVLRIFYIGNDPVNNNPTLALLSENGIDFTTQELADMLLRCEKFLSLSEMRPEGSNGAVNLNLTNVSWQPIDISCRIDLDSSYNPDDVRKTIQILLNKYLDYRYWRVGTKIQWVNLLEIVQRVPGVNAISDQYFFPSTDISIPINKLPRIRGFQMLDMNGSIIQDLQGQLNPIYFPNQIDFSYQATVLSQI